MPESNDLVVPAAVATAVISLAVTIRTRMALKKEQDHRQMLAIDLAIISYQRAVLNKMISDRHIRPTEEEARKLTTLIK